MTSLELYVRQSELGSEVHLYKIDLSIFGSGIAPIYITPYVVDGQTGVSFGGQFYTSFPVKLEGIQWDGKSAPTTPTIALGNLNSLATSLAETYDDLIGATLTRTRTFERYLDPITGVPNIGAEPDGTQKFADEQYTFEQAKAPTKDGIVFTLGTLADSRGKKIPARNALKRVCTRPYRTYVGSAFVSATQSYACPYNGAAMFKDDDTSTSNPALDACSHSEHGCALRFPDSDLPGYFFPGLAASSSI